MLSLFQDAYGVFLYFLETALLFSKNCFFAIHALLHSMSAVTPSSEVEPCIVLLVYVIEDDEKALRTTLFCGFHRHVNICGVVLSLKDASYIGIRSVCLLV